MSVCGCELVVLDVGTSDFLFLTFDVPLKENKRQKPKKEKQKVPVKLSPNLFSRLEVITQPWTFEYRQ